METAKSALRILTTGILLAVLPAACATAPKAVPPEPPPATAQADPAIHDRIAAILNTGGPTLDYDALLQVHRIMVQAPQPISRADVLLRQLIHKRNPNPRVDQMILIFAAKTIGQSRFAIPNAQALFDDILEQDGRINEWVLSFVAEAVGDYPFVLPQGDRLVDLMDVKLNRMMSQDRSGQEHFGFHFLPPPESKVIRSYIDGIQERLNRQRERTFYYILIKNGYTEARIEAALKDLQTRDTPGKDEKCRWLMRCLMQNRDQLLLN